MLRPFQEKHTAILAGGLPVISTGAGGREGAAWGSAQRSCSAAPEACPALAERQS